MDEITLTSTTKEKLVKEILKGIDILLLDNSKSKELKKEWLTSREVQELLKITSVTLWKYDKDGVTKPEKIGNRKRYNRFQINQLLQLKERKKTGRSEEFDLTYI